MRRVVVLLASLGACADPVVPASDATGGTTSDASTGTTTSGSSETGDGTTAMPEAESSTTVGEPDMGVPLPPLPTSRLVVDAETRSGHGLVLHEIVDGIPHPPQPLGEVPSGANLTVLPLGTADRIALDVRYADGTEDLFMVDWTEGHPATTTQLDDAVPASYWIGASAWVDDLAALVVRIADGYYRIDANEGAAAEPIPLLEDLDFGIALDETDTRFVMPVGPWLVVRGWTQFEVQLYAAEIDDPSAPVEQLTDYVDRGPSDAPMQLAAGHLVYQTGSISGADEVHVILREGDAWSMPIALPPPADMSGADCTLVAVRPGSDDIVYRAGMPDDPSVERLLLQRIEDGALAEPVVLHDDATAVHRFSPDGTRLLFVDELGAWQLVEFVDGSPSRPRVLEGLQTTAQEIASPRTITADNAWVYAQVRDTDTSEVQSIVRVGLTRDASRQVVAEIAAPGWIREYAITPDDRTLAFTTSSVAGLTTQLVDLSAAEPSAPMIADHGTAPMIRALVPSPDSNFIAAVMDHGGYPDEVAVIRRDDPEQAVLVLEDLVAEPVWLP